MDPRVKRVLIITGLVLLPAGGLLAGLYWYRTRGGTSVTAPWLAGLIATPAIELADKAGVGVNQYVLAAMMQSEGRADVDRIARGWVALNNAKQSGKTVFRVITDRKAWVGKDPKTGKVISKERSGYLGEQQRGGAYSTTKTPTKATLELARKLMEGLIKDPTGGALRFLDAKAFGVQPGTRTFAEVDAKWKAEGFRPMQIAGAASDFLVYRRTA